MARELSKEELERELRKLTMTNYTNLSRDAEGAVHHLLTTASQITGPGFTSPEFIDEHMSKAIANICTVTDNESSLCEGTKEWRKKQTEIKGLW